MAALTYRDSAKPASEILETYDVSTSKGGEALGCLGAIVILFLVALGVSVFMGTPRELEGWVWTFPVGAVVFALPTVWLWQKRKRKMHVVRDGDTLKLVVDGEVDITFPLTTSGSQMTERIRGVPMYHVYLKLVGREGRGVVLHEIRGAIHGEQTGWFDVIDKSAPAAAFDVSGKGQAALIRHRVETLNRGLDAG